MPQGALLAPSGLLQGIMHSVQGDKLFRRKAVANPYLLLETAACRSWAIIYPCAAMTSG